MPVDFVQGSWPCGHVATDVAVPCPFCLQSKLSTLEQERADWSGAVQALRSQLDDADALRIAAENRLSSGLVQAQRMSQWATGQAERDVLELISILRGSAVERQTPVACDHVWYKVAWTEPPDTPFVAGEYVRGRQCEACGIRERSE